MTTFNDARRVRIDRRGKTRIALINPVGIDYGFKLWFEIIKGEWFGETVR